MCPRHTARSTQRVSPSSSPFRSSSRPPRPRRAPIAQQKHSSNNLSLDQFSTLAFSPSETSLVYTAEENAPENDGDDAFAKFRFLPDYGEGYIGRKRPTLFVARWSPCAESESVDDVPSGGPTVRAISVASSVATPPPNGPISFGQAQFVADDTLLATGFEFSEDGKRLGIRVCFNRPTAIWELKLDVKRDADGREPSDGPTIAASATKVSDPSRACRSPRPIPGSNATTVTALWLSHELGGPHASCFSLHKSGLQARETTTTTIVPTIEKVREDFMGGFAGLYAENFLARPFVRSAGRVYLLTRTSQGSRLEVILIDLEQPETVVRLTPAESGEDLWSWSPLATDGRKWVLASRSAPTVPNELVLGKLEEHGGVLKVAWQVIEMPSLPPRGEPEPPGSDDRVFRLVASLTIGFSGECSSRAEGRFGPHTQPIPGGDDPYGTEATQGSAADDLYSRWPS